MSERTPSSSSITHAASDARPACRLRRVRHASRRFDDPSGDDPARDSVQTARICMHCEDPICAQVCPADAIKKTPDGIVQSSLKPRCIGCSNCVLACPFGVPKYKAEIDQMMKCDMCYDRTSIGKKPMCATVCPSGALTFTTRENIERTRRGVAIREWQFGGETVRTKVNVLVPRSVQRIDVSIEQIGMTTTDEYDVRNLLMGE